MTKPMKKRKKVFEGYMNEKEFNDCRYGDWVFLPPFLHKIGTPKEKNIKVRFTIQEV